MASNRVSSLTAKLEEYIIAKNSYVGLLDQYTAIVNQVMKNRKANNTSVSNSGDLVTTSQNVKMKTSSNTTAGYDDSLNSSDNSFKSALPWQGLDDMNNTYSDIVIQNNLKGMNSLSTDVCGEYDIPINSDNTLIEYDISQNTDCTLKFFKKCDGIAKMKNKTRFGLSGNSSRGCVCYTTDGNLTESTNSFLVGNSTLSGDVHYLGIMMNGSLYQLKNEIYHQNFDNLYQENSDNANELELGGEDDLNPFTGIYINTLKISGLGINNCE